MSYRNPSEALEPSIIKIIEGIDEFHEAVSQRIKALDEWDKSHIDEICCFRSQMTALKNSLERLKQETW